MHSPQYKVIWSVSDRQRHSVLIIHGVSSNADRAKVCDAVIRSNRLLYMPGDFLFISIPLQAQLSIIQSPVQTHQPSDNEIGEANNKLPHESHISRQNRF